jgi:hypothetical protein
MKIRWKVVITIALAMLWFSATQHFSNSRPQEAYTPSSNQEAYFPGDNQNMRVWYSDYNDSYFSGKLPKDVILDFSQTDPRFVATTDRIKKNRYHIAFNEDYVKTSVVGHLTLLHEMCHIPTYDEYDEVNGYHGRKWRACMTSLDLQGAFRRELIDSYQGE